MLKVKENTRKIKYLIIKMNTKYNYKKIKILLMQMIYIHLVKMNNKLTIKYKKKNYKTRI
jgi:hypothetical protein